MSILGGVAHYLYQVVIGIDQLGNALLAGDADNTISGRLNREDIIPILGPALRFALNKIQKDHTAKADEYDDLGLPDPHQLPPLGRAAWDAVMKAGDDYLSLPEALLKIAEENALLQRLRESGLKNCTECGRYL